MRIAPGAIVRIGANPIGENSFIGLYCYVNGDVRIGRNVLIGPYCSLPAGNHKFDPATQSFATKRDAAKPIVIGDGSWLASGCTVTGGVTVGRAISFARTPSSRTIRRIMRSWPARRPAGSGRSTGERRVPLLEVKRAFREHFPPEGGGKGGCREVYRETYRKHGFSVAGAGETVGLNPPPLQWVPEPGSAPYRVTVTRRGRRNPVRCRNGAEHLPLSRRAAGGAAIAGNGAPRAPTSAANGRSRFRRMPSNSCRRRRRSCSPRCLRSARATSIFRRSSLLWRPPIRSSWQFSNAM